MKTTDVPTAIDGILYDAKLKIDNGHSPGNTFYFVQKRLSELKKQLLQEGIYRRANRRVLLVEDEL